MEKAEHRFFIKYFWMNNRGSKKIHQERVTTLGTDAYSRFHIKTLLQRFRKGNLSCEDASLDILKREER
jgi:hypothetical protein